MKYISAFLFYFSFQIVFAMDDLTYDFVLKAEEGQKIFKKKLRRACRSTGAKFAQHHTNNEWEDLKKREQFRMEIYKLCPKSTLLLKDKWIEPLYAFTVIYAKNTNQFPE